MKNPDFNLKNTGAYFFCSTNKGFALPFVLGICLIIMVIASGIVSLARAKIRTGLELENRTRAYCKVKSAYSSTLYNVLRSSFEPYSIKIHQAGGKFQEWNLYGKDINLGEDVVVSLRDTAGMICVLYDFDLLKKLVMAAGLDSKTASFFMDAFLDWQDEDLLKRINGAESWEYKQNGLQYEPRNSYIQLTEEIKLILGFEPDIYGKILNSITYIPSGHKNYLTMDKKTLNALIGSKEQVDEIVNLREQKKITLARFRQITGIASSPLFVYSPSNRIMIKLKALHEKSSATIWAVIEKRPNQTDPFQILEWRK